MSCIATFSTSRVEKNNTRPEKRVPPCKMYSYQQVRTIQLMDIGCGSEIFNYFSSHAQSRFTLSGSDHSRSHSSPWSGTSVGRIIRRICSIDCRSGLKPPWQQKIFSSTIAATGRQLKQSVKVFHSLMLYLRLPKIHNCITIAFQVCIFVL